MEKTKYNNGNGQDIEKIPQEEMSLAISEWSEGNKNLQGAISSCIENGIPTIASCAGHSLVDSPYLAMRINKENIGNILNLINVFTNQPHTSILLSFAEKGSSLTIYGNMFNRNKCFETISQEAKNSLDLENANDITKSLWNAHVSLATHIYDISTKLYNSVEYVNGSARKRLIISPFGNKVLGKILTESGMKTTDTMFGSTVMQKSSIGKKGIIDTLNNVCDELEETMYESTYGVEITKRTNIYNNDFTAKIRETEKQSPEHNQTQPSQENKNNRT